MGSIVSNLIVAAGKGIREYRGESYYKETFNKKKALYSDPKDLLEALSESSTGEGDEKPRQRYLKMIGLGPGRLTNPFKSEILSKRTAQDSRLSDFYDKNRELLEKNIGSQHRARSYIKFLKQINQRARNQLIKAQKNELSNIDQKNKEKINQCKAKNAVELKAFDQIKAMNETALHQAASNELLHAFTFGLHPEKVKEAFKAATKKGDLDEDIFFQALTPKTRSGREIVRAEDGSYQMSFGARWLEPRKYGQAKYTVREDMRMLIETVKASGYPSITMDVNFSDEKLAKQRAQEAYEECIKAGYDPKNITINCNNQQFKPEPKQKPPTQAKMKQNMQATRKTQGPDAGPESPLQRS